MNLTDRIDNVIPPISSGAVGLAVGYTSGMKDLPLEQFSELGEAGIAGASFLLLWHTLYKPIKERCLEGKDKSLRDLALQEFFLINSLTYIAGAIYGLSATFY
jgi:hypothetical protein